ncbi:holo-ACP synthase [Saccharospirillum salsuginis]|uniref:Holo-[acyl-carrier-protein] synthase n=1 Tax=Saccharospirillum salsuginis TaxID=418750 RepID=A0A918KQP9_9GAMM|nr:holo-ACP synthase [Saccharospirillum salsuginis]GGX69871.1 holo-[acyl-carrier-protein] synthase [Saccharospirillum salsuginis]
MAQGIGTDIVEIERIARVLERQGDRFLNRILTPAERDEYQRRNRPVKFLANRFAGKEAVAKALGCGIADGVTFHCIEILPNAQGAPEVVLTDRAEERLGMAGAQKVLLSLADEHHYVVAFALIS